MPASVLQPRPSFTLAFFAAYPWRQQRRCASSLRALPFVLATFCQRGSAFSRACASARSALLGGFLPAKNAAARALKKENFIGLLLGFVVPALAGLGSLRLTHFGPGPCSKNQGRCEKACGLSYGAATAPASASRLSAIVTALAAISRAFAAIATSGTAAASMRCAATSPAAITTACGVTSAGACKL